MPLTLIFSSIPELVLDLKMILCFVLFSLVVASKGCAYSRPKIAWGNLFLLFSCLLMIDFYARHLEINP